MTHESTDDTAPPRPPSPDDARDTAAIEADVRRYPRWRERRRQTALRRSETCQLDRDAEDIIAFALSWLPFGGAPPDETFVQFGMSPSRFAERLWQIVDRFGCDREDAARFRQVYTQGTGRSARRLKGGP